MDISWEDVRVFWKAAEATSLSAAARELGVGQATVSRRVSQLEERLGYPLFRRSVDGVALTDAGESVLAAARVMSAGAEAFEQSARGQAGALKGKVRVAGPPGLAMDVLARMAPRLREDHPELRLEVLASIPFLDLARGDADLALRNRAPSEPELMTVATFAVQVVVFGSSAFVDDLPSPVALADLEWVGFAPPFENAEPDASLRRYLGTFEPVFTSDNFLILREAAAAGAGAIALNEHADRIDPRLVRVDIREPLPRTYFHIVAARSAWRSPRVRAMAKFVVDYIEREHHVKTQECVAFD